ncbi:ATP-binding protein [Asticcacaulis taihuensis]|uniref:ATP-binding protein n=1 Tax=Asticcacaulis taihuensis TaxID=260084 RepID=UPI0026EB5EB2|nr:ATP-binding protein [Asticcacaulis taihuensis]
MKKIRLFLETYRVSTLFVSVALLIAGCVVMAVIADAAHEKQVRESAQTQAQILADSISAALAFDDEDAIRQYTNALSANRDVVAVAVYDDKGRRVAQYGEDLDPARFKTGRQNAAGGASIGVSAPVRQKGRDLGTVFFRQKTDTYGGRVARYMGAALLLTFAALLLTVTTLDARALKASYERLRIEMAEREKAEAALRQSQKMEAVGRLTGGIAHDFNNMLAVVLGNNELLLRRFPDSDPKLLRFVTGSQDAARRAATLTHRLLAFSRRQPLDPKTVSPAQTILDLTELLRRTLGETISIETVNAAGLWKALIDVGQLETALVNLAVNARDAMPDGGKLTLETSNVFLDRNFADAQEDVVPGQYVLVAVTDTGSGMTPEVIQQVFEPFFTTKPVGQGTGLGLSQVHGFVKQSGGHIAIYSEPGHGTTVKLYLPRSLDTTETPVLEPSRRADRNRKDLAVLVVDDEPGVRDFTAEALVELGYDVFSADSGDSALALIEGGAKPDILLTDVVMPGKTGRALADMVSETLPNIRVLFMTGYTQNAIVHNGVLDRGIHLMVKPFTLDQLGHELEALGRA